MLHLMFVPVMIEFLHDGQHGGLGCFTIYHKIPDGIKKADVMT